MIEFLKLSKASFILVVIKLSDQRVKINPGRSKTKLIALKKYILISFNSSDVCARNF